MTNHLVNHRSDVESVQQAAQVRLCTWMKDGAPVISLKMNEEGSGEDLFAVQGVLKGLTKLCNDVEGK